MMLLIIAGSVSAQVTVSGSTGANSTYTTLKAAFDALNANGNQSGNNITISITASTTEVASASLNQSSISPWTSLTISPSGGAMRTLSGSVAGGALINLNGADNVVIDGLNSGGDGLTIENTSTSATAGTSTIRFIGDASNNTVQNCTIKGSGTGTTTGVVIFGTGSTTGNDNNTVSENIITLSGSDLPLNGVYSAGTSVSVDNSGNTVSNNDIQDYFGSAAASNGILIASSSSAWTITGNKFFQSATRTATAAVTHRAVQIVTALGVGYTVSNNTIGYADNAGTGVTTYNGAFGTLYRGIEMTVGIASSSSVQGNTVSGISFSTTSGTTTLPGIFSGIVVLGGSVDIGTSSPNTIGAGTGTGAISVTSTTSLGVITGIYVATVGTAAIENNIIGSISTGGAATIGYTFHGINTAGVLGNITVSGNTIGSTATAHSIAVGTDGVTTTPVCTFNGITNTATGTVTISGNTVQNVTAYGTGASVFNGIINTGGTGTLTITTNSVISGTITGTGAMIGISNSAAALTLSMNSNIVRNISRTNTGTFTALQNSGAVTTTIDINNNQLGNVSGGLISYSIATASALIGINNTGGATGASLSISGNDIRGISHTAASTQAHTYIINSAATLTQAISTNTFTGLNVNTTGAIVMISNNVIVQGSGTQEVNGNAVVTSFTRNASSASGALTLFTSTASSLTDAVITNNGNNFSNITVSGAATIAGWVNTDAGNPTKRLQNNTFSNWTGGTGAITAMNVNITGTSNSTSGNTISSISSAGNIIGITTGAGNDSIYQNTIHTLVSTGGTATTVVGISVTAGTVKSIYRNTIYNLQANNITTGSVVGIAVSAGTTNHLYRNKIYDLTSSSSGITTGYVCGIQVSGTTASLVTNISDNTIGTLQATAGSSTNLVQGINLLSSGATSSINVYYNTVYLNGSSSGTNYGTSGLYHAVSTTATTASLDLRNNIIVNISTPAGSGTTVAYRRSQGSSNRLANYASTSNNNLFYAGTPGASNLIYADGTSTAQTITAYTGGVFTAGTIAPRDAASVSEAPNWVSTTGSSGDFLHIDTGIATQIESGAAAIASYDNDVDDNIRQGSGGYGGAGTAPDIGADEFEGISNNITPPSINYTVLPNNSCVTTRTLSAVITDGTGIETTAGIKPRIWYKKSTNANSLPGTNDNTTDGWKYVEASNSSSPFSFTIDLSLVFGGVAAGNVIQYFVIAQNTLVTPLVGIFSGSFASTPASVALTGAAFPIGGTLKSFTILNGLSGTVTVGSGGDYTTLTGVGGLFATINTNGLSDNLTANIISDITELGTNSLNAIPEGCGSSYTLTIQPSGGALRTLSGSVAGGALINLNGADNLTIDGLNSGGDGLTIENTSTSATAGTSTIRFIGDASNNTVQNCTIKGSGTGTTTGVVIFGTGLTTGNDNNTVSGNIITLSGSDLPLNGVYSAGTSVSVDNSGNTVSNNDIQDYFGSAAASNGILIASSSSAWTITGNKFFQSATRTATAAATHRAIQIVTALGVGYTVSNNTIGYADNAGTGVTTYNGAFGTLYRGIEMTVGIASSSSVQGNTVSGISFSTTSGTTTLPGIFSGITVLAGSVEIGTSSPNTIGAGTGTGAISVTSTTSLGVITGIYVATVGTAAIENNIIGSISTGGAATIGYTFHGINTAGVLGNITTSGNTIGSTATAHSIAMGTSGVTTTGVCTFNGITNTATGTVTISGNTVQNVTAYGTGASVFNGIINSGGTGALTITTNNVISGTNTGTGAMLGISNSAAALTLSMNSNIVRNISRTNTGTFTALQNSGAVTTTIDINNNQLGNVSGGLISYSIATASALIGINNTGGATGASLSITGNDIRGISHTAASTQTHTYIINTAATLSQAINNNTFTGLNVNTTGAIVMISNNVIVQGSGTQEVNGNAVVTSFTRNASSASGALTLFTSTASSLTDAVITNNGNNFSNITVSGAATIAGWVNTDAGNPTKRLQNNTFSNWTGGTGAITVLTVNLTGSNNSTSGNTISSISSAGTITGITTGAGNDSIYQNTIHTLVSTGGTATTVVGIAVTAGTVKSIYRNTIYNLQANNITTGSVVGIAVSAGTTNHLYRNKIYDLTSSSAGITSGYVSGIRVSGTTASLVTNIFNNTIGTLQATAGSGTNLVQGINLLSTGATSSINLYYNTVYLNGSSSGTNYGTSGLYHTVNTTATTAKLDLRNNIIVNISTPAGSGTTVAYRRSQGTSNRLANYASTSNNNLFYAGTPGASNLIYADGTSTAQTITAYTGGVFTAGTIAPRDAASVTENPTWVSTTGSSSDFLHINTGVASQIESGGAAIASYDNDVDDNIRQGSGGYGGAGTAPDIGADEFEGVPPAVYYSKTTGNLELLLSWGSSTDGTGAVPANFTSNGMTFYVRNNAAPTIGAAWNVSGSGSLIIIGDGAAACNFTIPAAFAVTGTIDVSNNATLTIQNSTVPVIGTLASGSTVVFDGSGSQTIPAEPYHHLTSSSSGDRVLQNSGTIGISGTFTPGGNTYTVSGSTVEFNGSSAQTIPAFNYNNITSSSSGARTLAGAGTIGIAGTFTPGGNTYTVSGSTVEFNGSSAQTIPAFSYHHLTSSSSGSRALDAGGTIAIAGTFTKGTNSYSITGGTVEYNGIAAQDVVGLSYNHLTISGIGISTLQATSSIGGDLLISGGTFDLGAFTADRSAPGGSFTIAAGCTLRIGGNGTTLPANYSTTSFAPTAVIEYYGTNQTVPGGTYENLNIAGSGITVSLSSNVSVVGDLTVTGGTLDLGTFTANRSTPGGILNIGTSGTLKIGGTNTIPSNYAVYTFDPAGTVEYAGTKQTVGVFDYGNLTISASDTVTFPSGSTVRIAGTFTPGAGPFVTTGSIIEFNSPGAQSVAPFTYHDLILSTGGTKTFAAGTTGIAGSLTVSGATADATTNSSTIEYNGSSAQTITALTYHNLTFSNGGTKSILGTATVNQDVLANSGTVIVIDASGTLVIHGDLDNSGILTNDGTLNLVP